MTRLLGRRTLWTVAATVSAAATGWLGLFGFGWNDYDNEARVPVYALVHGHLGAFLREAPVYGGSLLERAPFALIPNLWGGGEFAVYRMLAIPCLLAGVALGLWLVAQIRRRDGSLLAQLVALGLCTANPLTLAALELGHPEELFGGCLCVAAVLLATRDKPVLAGLAIAAAIANKEWAVVALGPVLLALPARRMLLLSVAGMMSAALLAPFALAGHNAFGASLHGVATSSSAIFQPWQIWWFLGHHGEVVRGLFGGLKPGYRTAPNWVGAVSHPLIVLSAFALCIPVLPRLWRAGDTSAVAVQRVSDRPEPRRRVIPERDALLLLALVLLVRCVLDTWDTVYYPLPFLLALLSWETLAFRRPAIISLSSTVLVWVSCEWLPNFASADDQAAFFLAWTLPLAIGLSWAFYARGRTSVDERERLGQLRKPLRAVVVDRGQVLDAYTQAPG
ncbi:MAG TPA: glycosyltransferase 87 family protein [Solirubrobacteraceae bacterium]|nr:glycosyltransferase 87 family protein [Solirubrobacteraceae bacterium]